MLKKLALWIVGIFTALVAAGYVLLFTPFGNNLLKPLLQSKIDSLVPIKLEITEFRLTFDNIYLALRNGAYIDIVLDGDFWLPSQEFALTLNAYVQDISIFGELVDTPLQGSFKLEAQSSGTFNNFQLTAKSDIAKSFSTLHMHLLNGQIHNLDAQIQEANLQEILAMLGHKPYINGALNVHAKLEQGGVFQANAIVLQGVFDKDALKKDFDIELEDNTFKAHLDAHTQDTHIAHTLEFLAPIGTIHAHGTTLLPHTLTLPALSTLPTQSTFTLNLTNLTPFSPLLNRAIRGSLRSSGSIEGTGIVALEIKGESDLARSQTRYAMSLRDLKPHSLEIHTKGAAGQQLLWMLYLPPYANATLDLDLQASQLDSIPSATLSLQASGTLTDDTKTLGITLPRTPLALTLSGEITGDRGSGMISLSSDVLRLEAQPITIRDHMLHSPYTLHIQDLSKLALSSGMRLFGALELVGDMELDKILSVRFGTHSLGGDVRGEYRDSQLSAQLDSLSSHKILTLFGIPPILQAPLSGTLTYNTLASYGTLTLSGKEGKLAPNKLSSDVMRFVGVDMTRERYHDIALTALFDDASVNAEFRLDSPRTHLSSQKTHLNLQTKRIDSTLRLRIGESEANVRLSEGLAHPNVEIKNLILKSDQLLKGLGNLLNNTKKH